MRGFLSILVAVALTAATVGTAVAAPGPLYPIRPDDRAIRGHPPALRGSIDVRGSDDRSQATVARVEGFDWRDAGMGAAAAGALALLIIGGSAVLVRRQHSAYS